MSKENLILYFIQEKSLLAELDDLVIKWNDADEQSSFLDLVRTRRSRTDEPLLGYCDLLNRLQQNNVDIRESVDAFEVRFFHAGVSYAALDEFLADCRELKLPGDLINVAEGFVRALYERMILSDFLKVPCSIKKMSSKEEPVASISVQQIFEGMKSAIGSSDLNSSNNAVSIFAENLLKNASVFIDEGDNLKSAKNEGLTCEKIAAVLEEFIKIAAGLRKEILSNAFRPAQLVEIEDSIAIYEKLAVKQGFGSSVLIEYGKYLSTTLAYNPEKTMSDRLTKLSENLKQAFALARLEENVIREYKIKKDWIITPSIIQIEKFIELVRIVQRPEAEFLLAEYYSKPLAFEFDIVPALLAEPCRLRRLFSEYVVLAKDFL